MATTTSLMLLSKPAVAGDSGAWGGYLNTSIDLIDAHDHSVGKGTKVTAAGLNITSDVTFAGTGAVTNAKAVAFTSQASYTTNKSLFVLSADNELYWRSNAGTNVKITSGTSLNLSLVGGITGDYAASSASFYYDDANETYRALQAAPSPNVWAALAAGNVDLYEKASGITNRVRLSSPAALAASYALTFPAALPAATRVLQVSTAGAISAGGAVSMESTLGVTGLITATAGLTAAVDQHVTVSGTGRFKHGEIAVQIPAALGAVRITGTEWVFSNAGGIGEFLAPSANTQHVTFPIVLPVGARIKSYRVYVRDTAAGNTIGSTLNSLTASSGATAVLETSANSAGDGTRQTMSQSSITTTIAAGVLYFIDVVNNSATVTTHAIYGAAVTYDHP